MYIINVNHDSVIKQICQFRGNAHLINETHDASKEPKIPLWKWIKFFGSFDAP